MTRLVGTILLLACAGATWAVGPPDGEAWDRFAKVEEAERLNMRGVELYQKGKFTD